MSNLSFSNVLINNEEIREVNSESLTSNAFNNGMLSTQLLQNNNQISNNSSHSSSCNNIVVNLNLDNNRITNKLVPSSSQNESLDQRDENAKNSNDNNKENTKSALFYSSSSRSSLASPDSMKKSRQEEFYIFYQKCMKGIFTSINIIKAVMMRLVFSLHSLIAIVFVYWVKEDEWYFVNLLGVVFLQMELFITIIRRKGREPRWYFFI